MKSLKRYFPAFIAGLMMLSCQPASQENTSPDTANASAGESEAQVPASFNTDSAAAAIDALRASIEQAASAIKPMELSTANMREKIRQKWLKIHYYEKDGAVVRIKTYPYPQISKRTEEFYFQNGKLVLAVVEDNGEGEKGKPAEEIDKMYYFSDERLIKENKTPKETEYSVRSSDAEELLTEAKEYLDVLAKSKTPSKA